MPTASKMTYHLGDLCDIQIGYSVRGKLKLVDHDGLPVVQLRDTGSPPIDTGQLGRADLGDVDERYWVGEGDILFRTRFEPNIAIHLTDFPAKAVVMAPLVILRPKRGKADSAYLTWYINQPPAQLHFDRCARGSNLRMIPRECISSLEVMVPDIESQRRIVAVAELARREGELMNELAEKKKSYTSFALLQQARKSPVSMK